MSTQPIIYDPTNGAIINNAIPRGKLSAVFAPKFQGLFKKHRYKVRWGGRGGAKSWSFARALAIIAHHHKVRVLCARELQNSIKDSVHKLLSDQIEALGIRPWFYITQNSIVHLVTGSEFIFKGLSHNIAEIKSTEGVDIVWVEEAQTVTDESWEFLIPTIRQMKPHWTDGKISNPEIWISFNALEESDATYRRFVPRCNTCGKAFEDVPTAEQHAKLQVEHDMSMPPPDCDVRKVNWNDNPWFPEVLEFERQYMLKKDPAAYEHVWNGGCRIIGDAVIFKDQYVVEPFDTPSYGIRFYHGLDFGFADDPCALVRMWITDNLNDKKQVESQDLWIDREVYRHHLELDRMPKVFDIEMPSARKWPIFADNSRPESINFLKKRGYQIRPAEKWAGSIEDGIAYLKAFRMIHIHPRCTHFAIEARLYSWKVDKKQIDKNTGKPAILPEPVDAWNHCWDGSRYALDGHIHRGAADLWASLGRK